MEILILKIIGIILVTLLSITIIVARKDDVEIISVVIAVIFEIIALCLIYIPMENVIALIEKIINKDKIIRKKHKKFDIISKIGRLCLQI